MKEINILIQSVDSYKFKSASLIKNSVGCCWPPHRKTQVYAASHIFDEGHEQLQALLCLKFLEFGHKNPFLSITTREISITDSWSSDFSYFRTPLFSLVPY